MHKVTQHDADKFRAETQRRSKLSILQIDIKSTTKS